MLTRQGLPVLDLNSYPAIPAGVPLGGYILADSPAMERPRHHSYRYRIRSASGARRLVNGLLTEGVQARVVSMPSTNLFASQSDDYREKILPADVPLLVIEAGSPVDGSPLLAPGSPSLGLTPSAHPPPGRS